MSMKPSGTIFFQDDWEQQYRVEWETIGSVLDVTTTILQPYVWGEPPAGYVRDNIVYRRGTISIIRQVIRPLTTGYEIIAEGVSQFIDYIRMNFPCGGGPTDAFKYHLDCAISDECDMLVADGSRWADPDVAADQYAVWGDLNPDGSPMTLAASFDVLTWIDVWG